MKPLKVVTICMVVLAAAALTTAQNESSKTQIPGTSGPGYSRDIVPAFVVGLKSPVRVLGTATHEKLPGHDPIRHISYGLVINNQTGVHDIVPAGSVPNDTFPSKTVTQIQVGWIAEVPSGCTMSDYPKNTWVVAQGVAPVEDVAISPDKSQVVTTVFPKDTFDEIMDKWGILRLIVRYAPVYAKFSDETEWRYDLTPEKGFDNHDLSNKAICTPNSKEEFHQRYLQHLTENSPRSKMLNDALLERNSALQTGKPPLPRCLVWAWACNLVSAQNQWCQIITHCVNGCKDTHGNCCNQGTCPGPGGLCNNTICAVNEDCG